MTADTDPTLTGRAERILNRARDQQAKLNHPRLTAEHILLGLLTDHLCVALFVLRELQVDLKKFTDRIKAELERGLPEPAADEQAVLREAGRWVTELKQDAVGTEHLLLALVTLKTPGAEWLAQEGVREAEAKAATERLLDIVPRQSGVGVRLENEEA